MELTSNDHPRVRRIDVEPSARLFRRRMPSVSSSPLGDRMMASPTEFHATIADVTDEQRQNMAGLVQADDFNAEVVVRFLRDNGIDAHVDGSTGGFRFKAGDPARAAHVLFRLRLPTLIGQLRARSPDRRYRLNHPRDLFPEPSRPLAFPAPAPATLRKNRQRSSLRTADVRAAFEWMTQPLVGSAIWTTRRAMGSSSPPRYKRQRCSEPLVRVRFGRFSALARRRRPARRLSYSIRRPKPLRRRRPLPALLRRRRRSGMRGAGPFERDQPVLRVAPAACELDRRYDDESHDTSSRMQTPDRTAVSREVSHT